MVLDKTQFVVLGYFHVQPEQSPWLGADILARKMHHLDWSACQVSFILTG
jgi:hypothetical protein